MKRRPACTSPKRKPALVRLLEQEKIRQAQVAGIAEPFYFRSQDKPWLDRTLEMDEMPRRAVVMAPLDNLLWDRRMLKELFDFDYRWEVYVPARERAGPEWLETSLSQRTD